MNITKPDFLWNGGLTMWGLILFTFLLGGGWIALMICFASAFKTVVIYVDTDIKEMEEHRERIKDIK